MYSSLSREMEFNADKVAVSTSGSDAIISALWKLDGGSENWNNTINNAYLASQKNIFVKNLFTHNTLAIKREEVKQGEILDKLPIDIRGGRAFFRFGDVNVGMYASHPSNNKREDNAKIPFVECVEDNNSPWLLFVSKESLQEEMTSLVYEKYLNKKNENFVTLNEFENFISEETKGKKLLEEYLNTFENRFIHIAQIKELEEEAQKINQPYIEKLTNLKVDLSELMKPVSEIELLMMKAQQISEGTIKDKSFSFRGQTYKNKNLQEGYEILVAEREKLFNESFKEWDVSFCALNLVLAKKVEEDLKLKNLYRQHAILTCVYKSLVNIKNTIIEELNILQSNEDITHSEVNTFGEKVNGLVFGLNGELDAFEKMTFVPLPNIDNVKELRESIVENGYFNKESGPIFENGGFDRIINSIETAISHCQRIDQKSIGVILLFLGELQNQFDEKIEHMKEV